MIGVGLPLQQSAQGTTRAKHPAERQDFVVAELNHRVRNILALIRGLIDQTETDGVETLDYVAALGGRVQALAHAHDHATRDGGLCGTLTALFEDEIAAFMPTKRDRFKVIGPAVRFHSRALSTLALVIHELVTNSVKHGAFSAAGNVELRVVDTSDGVRMAWRERLGPTIVEPFRRGFGSVIIERMIPFDLQGLAQTRYPSTGFEADFFIPATHIVGEAEAPVATQIDEAPPSALPYRPLEGLSVLLVEDNMIIAHQAEELLRLLGAIKVAIAADLPAAESVIDQGGVNLVMLDVGIGNLTSAPFARRLAAASIAFFFATGFNVRPGEPEEFADIPIVVKPYNLSDLRAAANQSFTFRILVG